MNHRTHTTIMITSPLEAEHAERIAAAFPDRTEVIYRPDLMPAPHYQGDHDGDPDWSLSPVQQQEWDALLARAEVMWDFPKDRPGHPHDRSPHLRWVQTTSAGVGQSVRRLGVRPGEILVTTASGVHAQPLAEFAIGALLFHNKRFAHLQAEQRRHGWERFCANELARQTLAIIGPGRIGQEVARLARAFRMRTVAMGRTSTPERAAEIGVDAVYPRERLHDMLAEADGLVLCAPHTADTEGMIDADAIAAMKPGIVLINIARGAMIDEDAMTDALRSGHIGFAALDVFSTEPLPDASPLWDLPNVLVSPHSASTVAQENARLTDRFIENLGHYLDGNLDAMQPQLDIERLY